MISHQIISSALLLAACCLTGCDDGRIYADSNSLTQEGLTAEIRCTLSGVDYWRSSQSYFLSAATFDDASDQYASVSLNISPEAARGERLVLSGVPASASSIEICVLDRLRKKVVTFGSFDLAGAPVEADTVRFDAGAIDVAPLAALQTVLFTPACSACHGGSANAAAGLSLLTADETRANTVGVEARRVLPGAELRVSPGEPEASLLYLALTTDISTRWVYDHSVELVNPSLSDILRLWITSAGRNDEPK